MRSRAPWRSPGRSSSGCATTSGSSATPPRSRRSPVPCRTAGDVVFVPAFSGLFAPHWRSDARGIIAGLTRFATRGPHRPGRAGGDRVPGLRPRASRWTADLGAALPGRAARRRRDDPQRAADAVPGRHPRPTGRGAADRRDHRPRRRLCSRARGRVLERARRAPRRWTRSHGAGSRTMDAATRAAGIARWHKGVERTLGWVEPGA